MGPNWPSCYFHPQLKLYLAIYVDDFKLSGPTQNMKEGWAKLRKGLSIETEKSLTFEEGVISGTYLGCEQEIRRTKMPDGKVIPSFSYSMESFLGSCVDRYLELAPPGTKLKSVPTPFVPEDTKDGPAGRPCQATGPVAQCPHCATAQALPKISCTWCQESFMPQPSSTIAELDAKRGKKRRKTSSATGVSPRG